VNKYLTRCGCGRQTSRAYARKNGGKCKACVHPEQREQIEASAAERRNATIIDYGYYAYAREEGHYDLPDYA
jgi:hypothetical protein